MARGSACVQEIRFTHVQPITEDSTPTHVLQAAVWGSGLARKKVPKPKLSDSTTMAGMANRRAAGR